GVAFRPRRVARGAPDAVVVLETMAAAEEIAVREREQRFGVGVRAAVAFVSLGEKSIDLLLERRLQCRTRFDARFVHEELPVPHGQVLGVARAKRFELLVRTLAIAVVETQISGEDGICGGGGWRL